MNLAPTLMKSNNLLEIPYASSILASALAPILVMFQVSIPFADPSFIKLKRVFGTPKPASALAEISIV